MADCAHLTLNQIAQLQTPETDDKYERRILLDKKFREIENYFGYEEQDFE